MKHTSIMLSLLSLVALLAWGSTSESTEVSSTDTFGTIGPAMSGGEVVALRPITIKQGADAKAFEKYVAATYTPAFDKFVPGVQAFVMRADRGKDKGQYVQVFVFDSAETRDFYFPQEGGDLSEAGAKLWDPLPDFDMSMYLAPADSTTVNYTDYVVIE
jgi:hypothetical protein